MPDSTGGDVQAFIDRLELTSDETIASALFILPDAELARIYNLFATEFDWRNNFEQRMTYHKEEGLIRRGTTKE